MAKGFPDILTGMLGFCGVFPLPHGQLKWQIFSLEEMMLFSPDLAVILDGHLEQLIAAIGRELSALVP